MEDKNISIIEGVMGTKNLIWETKENETLYLGPTRNPQMDLMIRIRENKDKDVTEQ